MTNEDLARAVYGAKMLGDKALAARLVNGKEVHCPEHLNLDDLAFLRRAAPTVLDLADQLHALRAALAASEATAAALSEEVKNLRAAVVAAKTTDNGRITL